MSFGDRVRERRKALKLTQQGLSKAINARGGELSQQQIAAIEKGIVERPRSLPELASALKTTTDYLLHEKGPIEAASDPVVVAPPPAIELAANDTGREPMVYPETQVSFPSQTRGRPDIPLWASAAAGDEGAMVLVPDPIDYLRRSERMLSVRNPFAFNVLGDSMDPAIEHGDQVIINPSITARPGLNCVFISEGADGMHALVKRLLRARPEHWEVRQFNPKKDFTISRRKWGRVHPVAEIRKAGVG